MAELTGSTFTVVAQADNIQAAREILCAMATAYEKVDLNKRKVGGLLERYERVIPAIEKELQYSAADTNTSTAMERLLSELHVSEETITSLSQIGALKALLRREEIYNRIEDHHKRLTECLMQFEGAIDQALIDYKTEFERDRATDAEYLEAEFRRLKTDDKALIQRLDISQNQLEALAAVHYNLHKRIDRSAERYILLDALCSLHRTTGKDLPKKPHTWTITSYDVDIEPGEVLGDGGFSTVRKGRWGKLVVAVKEMKGMKDIDSGFMDPQVTQMLYREIRVWKGLRHNHVLQFYGASLDARPPFLVSRYMKNGNITQYLKFTNPGANRVKLAHEIALGMVYIHDSSIVHGDLKGANVLIDDAGGACITDFGLSKIRLQATTLQAMPLAETSPRSATGAGTLRYMSPEAMHGHCTRGGDVYSYGMTLYEVFTDNPPFRYVPTELLYAQIFGENKRLERPENPDFKDRGLTDGMWRLIWMSSDPTASARPRFDAICNTTEGLLKDWRWDEQPCHDLPSLQGPLGGVVFDPSRTRQSQALTDSSDGSIRSPEFSETARPGLPGALAAMSLNDDQPYHLDSIPGRVSPPLPDAITYLQSDSPRPTSRQSFQTIGSALDAVSPARAVGEYPAPRYHQLLVLPDAVAKRILIVGDPGTGKKTLARSLPDSVLSGSTGGIIGSTAFRVDKRDVQLELFTHPCAGPRNLPDLSDINVVIICLAIDHRESLGGVREWASLVHRSRPEIPITIVGCKLDLRYSGPDRARTFSFDEAEGLAMDAGAHEYFECSALHNENVMALFQHAAKATMAVKEGGGVFGWAKKLLRRRGGGGRRSRTPSPSPDGFHPRAPSPSSKPNSI